MNKFLRRNNKKLLAVFGVFLMIAFIVQTRYNPSSNGRGTAVIGRFGDNNVTETDLENSRQDWKLLNQSLFVEYPPQSARYHPFFPYEFEPAAAIDQDPKLYLLLQKEAQRLGSSITEQDVQTFLADPQVGIQLPSGSVTKFDQIQSLDPDYAAQVHDAVAGFLRVRVASNRALDLCKFSRPLRDLKLSQDHQRIAVRLVVFDANKLAAKLPAPTTQQLQSQFDQYADVQSTGSMSEKNPLGFGYKIPDQVKLQTLSISRKQLKDAVMQSKSAYDWEVASRGYYLKHEADFPASQPAASPTTATTVSSTEPAPTTRPFDQVRTQILDSVMAPDVDALSDRVQSSVLTMLSENWAAYHAASPSTMATTSNATLASTLGPPYGSFEFLRSLAAKVQKDFGFLPEITDHNQPLSGDGLVRLAGIGQARTTSGSVSFVNAVMDPGQALLAPSPMLQDDASTIYFFRVTERIPAHRPSSIDAVVAVVHDDWIKDQAYQLALKQANVLRDAAAASGLDAAASVAGEKVSTTDSFSINTTAGAEPVAKVPLSGADIFAFKQQCQAVLTAAANHASPVAVIEAANESKVLVIELADVQTDWPRDQKYLADSEATRDLLREFLRGIEQQWFTLPAVEARLGWTDSQKDKDAS